MIQYLPITLTILAFLLTIARPLSPVLAPWLGKWQWAPPAGVLFLAFLSSRLVGILGAEPVFSPDVSATLQVVDSVVQAVVGLIQAYQQGHGESPKVGSGSAAKLSLFSVIALGFLFVSGCAPSLSQSTERWVLKRNAPIAAGQYPVAMQVDQTECLKISRRRSRWIAATVTLGVCSGASGITSLPINGREAKVILESSSLACLAAGAFTASMAASETALYTESGCAQ